MCYTLCCTIWCFLFGNAFFPTQKVVKKQIYLSNVHIVCSHIVPVKLNHQYNFPTSLTRNGDMVANLSFSSRFLCLGSCAHQFVSLALPSYIIPDNDEIFEIGLRSHLPEAVNAFEVGFQFAILFSIG